ncbi:hypothetical protein [Candidatus Binatus sp.]|uniref:hypothetical protein n=1 Tax=Candidatus Binatus sp. TaxID=2811406 RepID=UPI003BB06053
MNASETEPQTGAQAAPATTTIAPASWTSRIEAGLLRRLLIVGVLSVLVMIGLFLTNVSHLHARYYWSAMFPIFGFVSLWHELAGPNSNVGPVWRRILRQVLHWLGPIVAVQIIFLQLARGQMDADSVALVTLIILAVTCFIAGVHMDRSFYWVSAALALAAVIGTEVEAYLWMLAAIAIIAVAITVFAATALRRRTTEPARAGG